ncbi:MAG: LysE family translocator [Chloroflexi bacterium]|nr:LysE family translocator [Chloroflexota bacterium]MCL5275403.1 LysE family translocator [Chloroflexota bacterium]
MTLYSIMGCVDAYTPLLLRGMLIGLAIAAPVGPIGLLCIQRTLSYGRAYGLVSGLGAASADAAYGSVAAFGLTLVSNLLVGMQTPLRLLGGIYLCYLGIRTFRQAEREQVVSSSRGIAGAYLSTFLLTLTNPMTVLSFVAIFAGLGVGVERGNVLSGGVVVLGVFAGSAAWWLFLSAFTGFVGARLAPRIMQWIRWISGLVILGFGAATLLGLLIPRAM